MYRLLITVLLLSGSICAVSQDTSSNQEKLIYIMPLHKGWELVEQCTRSVYYPDSFWRVTEDQVDAIEKRLIKKIQQLRAQNATFVPDDLSHYKRQYIGFEMDGQSYYYGNFFPKTALLEFDPSQKGVVTCRSDKRYWSMLFNIDSFKFETIERNDKMVKPKGALDPRLYDDNPPEPEK